MKFIDYSVDNPVVVRFLVVLLVIGGIFSYMRLGKLEDPEFKIKEALVVTLYPEADAHSVELYVTDVIEQALQKIPNLEFTQSVSQQGYSQVKIKLKESVPTREIEQYWDNVRKKINDAKLQLPLGTLDPIVLDDYGAVYGMFLAVTADETYTLPELQKYTEYVTQVLNGIDGVAQVSEFGKVNQAIIVRLDKEKVHAMGLNPKTIAASLFLDNLITGASAVNYGDLRIPLRLTNKVNTLEKLAELVVFSQKLPDGTMQTVRLKDIAELERGVAEPVTQKMFYNGKRAMGVSLSPETGSNVVESGEKIDKKLEELKEKLPVGINVEKVYYQPELVTNAINNFVWNLLLSVVTVVGVLLFTMGMRSGLIIGSGLVFSILGTLIFMLFIKIDLQRVSLAAFIIAMGMLVDNSIVVVDRVLVLRQKGMAMRDILLEATKKPAMPLLGATAIAALAFLPAYLMPTYGGEYVGSLFWVVGISLMLSWFLCLTQTPVYCDLYLSKAEVAPVSDREKRFYRKCRRILYVLLKNKNKTLLAVLAAFALAMVLFAFIPKIFFPPSDKKGFTVNVWVDEGSRIERVEEAGKKLADFIRNQEGVTDVVLATGASVPRYYVATIPQAPNPSYAQIIVNLEDLEYFEELDKKIASFAESSLPEVMTGVRMYPNGVPTPYPIELAFSGPDPAVLRTLADRALQIMQKNSDITGATTDWRNSILVWEGKYSDFLAKQVHVMPSDIAAALMANGDGISIGKIQEDGELVSVILKENRTDSIDLSNIGQTPVWGAQNRSVPLSSVITEENMRFEDSQIWRRNRERTITVQCDVAYGKMAGDVRNELLREIKKMDLPKGYKMFWLGEYHEQNKNNEAIIKNVPATALIMLTICVLLFGNIKVPLLIFLSLPFAFIGIVPGLFLTGKTFGFMSIVGAISLSGMMIKNIIVLVDEINFEINVLKKNKFIALIDSAISRIRSVSLAAVTTIFGMLPLLFDPLFGDMSATIVFGLFVSTVLTLFIFPVLYAFAYKIDLKK